MNTPYIAEFRKKLSAAHRRKISNSLKRRGQGDDEGNKFDKAILRTTHIANSANNATKAYYNIARGAKDFQLVRKYGQQMRPVSRMQKLANSLDSGIKRSEAGSRIVSRLSLIPARLPRDITRTMTKNSSGYTMNQVVRLSRLL